MSRLQIQVELALNEIDYQKSIIDSDLIASEQKCMMMMFAQAKIGQSIREIHDIMGIDEKNRSKADNELIKLIENTPLLKEERVKIIESRNKGIAHEILNFDEQSMFRTIVNTSGHIRSCLEAILYVANISEPTIQTLNQSSMNAFVLRCQNTVEAYTRLGSHDDARKYLDQANQRLHQYAEQQSNLSAEEREILCLGLAVIEIELATLTGGMISYEKIEQWMDSIDRFEAKLEDYSSLRGLCLSQRLNIGNLLIPAEKYQHAIKCFNAVLIVSKDLMSNIELRQTLTSIQQSAMMGIAQAYIKLNECALATEALAQVNYDDIDPQSKSLQFNYLYLECILLYSANEIDKLSSKQLEIGKLLDRYKGYFKASYGGLEYLRRKVKCKEFAIFCFVLSSVKLFNKNGLKVTEEYIDTTEQLLANVLWLYENRTNSNILVNKKTVGYLVNTTMRFLEAIIDDRISNCYSELFVDRYHDRLYMILSHLEKIIIGYSNENTLTNVFYCAYDCYQRDNEIESEDKFRILMLTIKSAENERDQLVSESHDRERKTVNDSNQRIERLEKIIVNSILKVHRLYVNASERSGLENARLQIVCRVRAINEIARIVYSAFTLNILTDLASANFKLRYYIDSGKNKVKVIRKAGYQLEHKLRHDGQELVFRALPSTLPNRICQRLGLIRMSIQNICLDAIKTLQDRFPTTTLEPKIVVGLSSVKASYSLICKKSLQTDVCQALQDLEQPESSLEVAQASMI